MLARSYRALATVVAATVAVGMVGTTAAQAKPPTKPGGVTVTASATEPAIGSYAVAVSWNTVTNATSYKATISRSGAILDSTKVTAPTTTWHATVAAVPGQQLSVSVRALVGTRQGKPATKTLVLTDQIAPTATYASVADTNTGAASLTENGLTDDSPASGITRTVDWGDGHTLVYGPGELITHNYALTEDRYVPHVTLKDAAGHTSETDATADRHRRHPAPDGHLHGGRAHCLGKTHLRDRHPVRARGQLEPGGDHRPLGRLGRRDRHGVADRRQPVPRVRRCRRASPRRSPSPTRHSTAFRSTPPPPWSSAPTP